MSWEKGQTRRSRGGDASVNQNVRGLLSGTSSPHLTLSFSSTLSLEILANVSAAKGVHTISSSQDARTRIFCLHLLSFLSPTKGEQNNFINRISSSFSHVKGSRKRFSDRQLSSNIRLPTRSTLCTRFLTLMLH